MIELHVHTEAEQSVLGSVLLVGEMLEMLLVEVGLRPEHFYVDRHRAIFSAMVELHDADKAIDVMTVSEQLGDRLQAVGGRNAVDEMAGYSPAAGNVRDYAEIVLDRATWRTRGAGVEAMRHAVGRRDEAAFGVAEAMLAVADRAESTTSTARQLSDDVFEYLATTGSPDCIPTPFEVLNELLAGGLYPGDTTVLTAWNNFGKTIIMHQLLEHAREVREGVRAHIYSNEMSKRDYTLRAVSAYSGVSVSRLKMRRLTDDERARALRGLEHFEKLGIGITGSAGWSALDIARHIRRSRWDIYGLDHLHLVPFRDEIDLGTNSQTLNAATRQSGSHGLLLCQLNLERNKGPVPPRPIRRDIRGSGRIADDATNVLMLHREMVELTIGGRGTGVYEQSLDGELYFEKVRTGSIGGIAVRLDPKRVRFVVSDRSRLEMVA